MSKIDYKKIVAKITFGLLSLLFIFLTTFLNSWRKSGKISKWILTPLIVLSIGVGSVFGYLAITKDNLSFAAAGDFYTQDFEGLSTGDLNGQDGWASDTSYDVSTSNPQSGSQNVTQTSASEVQIKRSLTAVTGNKIQSFYIRGNDFNGRQTAVKFWTSSGATLVFQLGSVTGANEIRLNSTAVKSGVNDNQWYQVELEIDTSRNSGNGQGRARVDGGTWTSWVNGTNNFGSGIDAISLNGNNANELSQWDDFEDTTPEATVGEELIIQFD